MLWENFQSFVTESITIEPFIDQDAVGKPRYGSPISIPAVLQGPDRRYIQAAGQELLPRSRAFIGPDVLVDARDRVTLAGSIVPALLSVDRMNLGQAVDYQVLSFA